MNYIKYPLNEERRTKNQELDNAETLVKVDCVSKKFCRDLKKSLWYGMKDLGGELMGRGKDKDELRPEEFWAVKDVSFELKRGECLGLIGRNGAGKTTLLRMLNGLIKPDKGRIEMRGRVGALIALGAGFNPILTGRENIYVNAAVLGLSKKETDEKFDEIVDFAELGEFIDAPVQSYSSGMQVRLGFAVASTFNPDVLILDEVLVVGDIEFRFKCWRRISEVMKKSSVILVSHSKSDITRLASLGLLLEKGVVAAHGTVLDVMLEYNRSISNNSKSSGMQKISSKSEKIISYKFDKNHYTILNGDPLNMIIFLKSRYETLIGRIEFTLMDCEEVPVCKGTIGEANIYVNSEKKVEIKIEIPSIHLVGGVYYIIVGAWDKVTREMLFYSRLESSLGIESDDINLNDIGLCKYYTKIDAFSM